MFRGFMQDARVALRSLLREPARVGLIVLTLALGIGANTATFTLLEAVLFRPLQVPDSRGLAWVSEMEGRNGYRALSWPDYLTFHENRNRLGDILAFSSTEVALGGQTPRTAQATVVSNSYFAVLRLKPQLGSLLPATDESPSTTPNGVVLSDAFWRSHYGADPAVLDSSIRVNGHPVPVLGVAPRGFRGIELDEGADLWLPMQLAAQVVPGYAKLLANDNAGWLRAITRLRSGLSDKQGAGIAASIGATLHPAQTQRNERPRIALSPVLGGLDPANRNQALPVFALLSFVPLLVLLVAAANAANLQLARVLARRREIAIRRAIGGSRGRVVRQLLTESVMLSTIAGVIGVGASFALMGAIGRLGSVPAFLIDIEPDARVLALTAVLSVIAGIAFGAMPALLITRRDLTPALKEQGLTLQVAGGRHRVRDLLVVAQVTVSLVLLIVAGLFLRSLQKAVSVDPGFTMRDGLVAYYDVGRLGYDLPKRELFHARVLAAVRSIPGVAQAALTSSMPLSGRMISNDVLADTAAPKSYGTNAGIASISVGYFSTMGIPLVRGRDFALSDTRTSGPVVIINETLARRTFGSANPIGRQVRLSGENEPLREVVGVARDGRYASLTDDAMGYIYFPAQQFEAYESAMTVVIRSRGDGAALAAPVRRVFAALERDLPLSRVETIAQMLVRGADKQQAAAAMLGVFGGLGMLLAALGLYGVAAHAVTLRTREIGIRLALGANRRSVLRLFMREGLARTSIGLVIGLVISLAMSKVLAGLLFGLQPTDVITFVAATAMLAFVALVASAVPARRAARVDPVVSLRRD